MKTQKQIESKELPSQFADKLGLEYTKTVTTEFKKSTGQFFSPTEIARLMASLSEKDSTNLKILDAGCGTLVLSCALIEHHVKSNHSIEKIELVGYENDSKLLEYAKESVIYLENWLRSKNIKFEYDLHPDDFILENVSSIKSTEKTQDLFEDTKSRYFDIIISNPPYFKLPKEDERV